LMLLELLATERVSVNRLLAKLEKQFGPHHYGRIDMHYPLESACRLMEFLEKQSAGQTFRLAACDTRRSTV